MQSSWDAGAEPKEFVQAGSTCSSGLRGKRVLSEWSDHPHECVLGRCRPGGFWREGTEQAELPTEAVKLFPPLLSFEKGDKMESLW